MTPAGRWDLAQVRVAPTLVEQTGRVATGVGDEVVRTDPGVARQPTTRAFQLRAPLVDQARPAGGGHRGVDQADPPRRGVDAAVVREAPPELLAELHPHPVGRTGGHLVGDLARLLFASTVVHPSLARPEGDDGGQGHVGPLGQELERGDAGVTAEQAGEAGQAGHEPPFGCILVTGRPTFTG